MKLYTELMFLCFSEITEKNSQSLNFTRKLETYGWFLICKVLTRLFFTLYISNFISSLSTILRQITFGKREHFWDNFINVLLFNEYNPIANFFERIVQTISVDFYLFIFFVRMYLIDNCICWFSLINNLFFKFVSNIYCY